MPDASFEAFVREALPGLTRYARALTGNIDSADDLVQSTLVKVTVAWGRVNADGNPLGYTRTALFRTFVSWRRLPQHRDIAMGSESATFDAGYGTVEQRAELLRALARLPRRQRAVLVASYVADEPDDVIAELVGRTPSGVRTLRRRGLIALRAALADPRDPVAAAVRIEGDPS